MTAATESDLRRQPPLSNRDFDFFYEGLAQRRLLVQRCRGCGALRNPPSPACPACQSLAWDAVPLQGQGSIYSFTIHHHPPLPDFPAPHPIVLAEMAEGIRLLGAMDGVHPDRIRIGAPVEIEFVMRGATPAFRFRPAER